MVPPTGAADSILVVRRNGATVDTYYGAPATQLKNYPMESNDNKVKKQWGDRWKVGKSGRPESHVPEAPSFVVHPDYLHKYGTLSNGVLTKSIKYAETWLYGTVGVRSAPAHRPSLFLYPGVVKPAPRMVAQSGQPPGYMPAPAGFLPVPVPKYPCVDRNGTVRSHRALLKTPEQCQCGDYRREVKKGGVGSPCRKCGGRRSANGTVRGGGSHPHRATLLEITTPHDKGGPQGKAQDPYNLMRKNRLSVGEVVPEPSIFHVDPSPHKRMMGKSLSPMRGKTREAPCPSFETFKPKQTEEELKSWKGEEEWTNGEEEDEDEDDRMKRRSILECDVNAYELNRKKGSRDTDDSSDELSDGTLEVNAKLKILRPRLSKTDVLGRKARAPEGEKAGGGCEGGKKAEVRLSGQRFKIFDHSTPSTDSVEGYVSDDQGDSGGGPRRDVYIPRLTSPKRPPRRLKDKSPEANSFKYSKSKSKSSPNLSIKSILKKPTGQEDGSESSTPTTPNADESESPTETRREILLRSMQTTGKSNQNTFKKKKQVQFKVNVSNESLADEANGSGERGDGDGDGCDADGRTVKGSDEVVQRSVSCEDLLLANDVERDVPNGSDAEDGRVESCERMDAVKAEGAASITEEGDSDTQSQSSTLKRSYSDRRPSGAATHPKDDAHVATSPPSANLFNDTMALRVRSPRTDTRDIFAEEGVRFRTAEEDGREYQRSRPKEPPPQTPPPPPPPPPAEDADATKPPRNLITYAEFAKLTDQKEISADKAYLRRIRCKSLDNTATMMKAGKSPPSPPPRQAHVKARKLSSPGATSIRLQVPSLDDRSGRVSIVGCLGGRTPIAAGEISDNKTIVTLSPSAGAVDATGPSVTIHRKNAAEEYVRKEGFGKTSVMINSFRKEDSNKVTISVRNEVSVDEEPNSSTCTIIETGSNSTVIPVMSTDNKTTLIVGNSTSPPVTDGADKADRPSQYIFSNIAAVGQDSVKGVEAMDPVEAIRRNLIPHICGKEENSQTLMEKIKQSRESKEQKNLKQISQLFARAPVAEEAPVQHPGESLLATYQAKRNLTNWKTTAAGGFKIEEDAVSLADSFGSSVKNSSTNTSRSNSFRSNSTKNPESDYDTNPFLPMSIERSKYYILSDAEDTVTQERDKLEDEYEIRSGLSEAKKEETENIYETIKEEPIYDQIGVKVAAEESDDDIPPPLPLTLPPSLDELDKRSPKSIFEGASKYDILSYLVDAKDRVQEDTYFSGSSTSEEIDSRRLSLVEEGERTSFDSGMHCRSPSDGLEGEENLRRLETCKKDTSLESDSSVDLSSRISQISQASDSSDDNLILTALTERESLKLNRKSSAEIERNDSGVGSETSQTSRSKWQASSSIREDPQHLCEDCDQIVETQVTDSGVMYAPLVCRKCSKRRSERKEIIQEIAETEEKYGRDLRIILEEFYRPMLVAGLLTPEQLSAIFLNTEELLDNNEQLTEKLRDTLEIAVEQGDEDLLTVNIGKLFLEAGPMLHAFESYCTRQATAAVLLANLEKEKELLRIFLRVSQMENTVLRRMNLNSFLMVPVQRVTKYPLLLARLYKVTPPQHESRELLKEAQHNIELHLEHMNSEAKDLSAIKVWRRFSASTASGRKSTAELEMINIKLRKMAIDVLEWNHEEVRFVMEGKLLYTQPTDNNWKRGRTIKLSPIFVLLVTLGKPNSKYKAEPSEEELTFPKKTGVREATLLLVKEKCGRYTLIREPLYLDKIIVCCETEADEYFEIQELSTKDTIIFKAEDGERTKEWYRQLQYHAQILGSWRRRRNALANIMINGMMARSYTT